MINSLTVDKLKLIGFISVVLVVFIMLAVFAVKLFKPKYAGIYVETNPPASVFIERVEVGKTPYKANIKPGEIELRLIPESLDKNLASYSTKVFLTPGVETVVRRNFGEFEETSVGEIISFEKVAGDDISLVVITTPDSAQLLIDHKDRAFTPHKTSSISEGEHSLTLSANGYEEHDIKVKTHKGYKLTAIVKLAKKPAQIEETNVEKPQEESETLKEPQVIVEILDTGVGFLRVREEASTLGEEVGRVSPGERYPLIEEDQRSGWYKIEYKEGVSGWISNQYAKKIKESITPEPTISISPTSLLKPTEP